MQPTIKKLNKSDLSHFQQLIQLFNEVFENENSPIASESHLSTLLEKNEFIVFAAFVNNEIAGGITAYELPSYSSDQSEVYVYDIAVKSQFQRKGFGQKMLQALKQHCAENNITLLFVEAHEKDKHAVDFYRKAGGQAEKVVHFNFTATA